MRTETAVSHAFFKNVLPRLFIYEVIFEIDECCSKQLCTVLKILVEFNISFFWLAAQVVTYFQLLYLD